MRDKRSCRGCRSVLEQETVIFGGMILEYSLLLLCGEVDRFRVRVSLGTETAECSLGDRMGPAVERYRMLVRGTVTPCCLHEVMEELCG